MRSSWLRGSPDPGPELPESFRRKAVCRLRVGCGHRGQADTFSSPLPIFRRPATTIPEPHLKKKPTAPWTRRGRSVLQMKESACKPGSVRPRARQSFLWAWRHRQAQATYPGATRATPLLPYSVLLRVGFTVPRGVVPARGALLPHPFTLATRARRRRSAVCSLLHWPSVRTAQALPGTLPCGARTFLDAPKRTATVRPTPLVIVWPGVGNREWGMVKSRRRRKCEPFPIPHSPFPAHKAPCAARH